MFQGNHFELAKTKLMAAAVTVIIGATVIAVPTGTQAEAAGFSLRAGPTYNGQARATQYGVSQADVYRTLRRRGFTHIRNVRNHGDHYTAQGIRGRYHYLVYVNARTGRIFNVDRIR